MGKFLDKLEAWFGRKCPKYNVREWDSKYRTVYLQANPTLDYWSKEIPVEVTHLRCGYRWRETQVTPTGGGGE